MAVAKTMYIRAASGLIVAAASLWLAAPAAAAPLCTDTAPNTRFCQSPGHAQIVTSPDPAMTNSYPGWGYGSLGFGQGGIWFGF